MTYAKSRLMLGIFCVGFYVLLSLNIVICKPLDIFLLSEITSNYQFVYFAIQIFLIYLIIQLPFDYLGGYFLPKKFAKTDKSFNQFVFCLVKGSLAQITFFTFCAFLYYYFSNVLGLFGIIFISILSQITLLYFQQLFAKIVGSFKKQISNPEIIFIDSNDKGFTGGISGIFKPSLITFPSFYKDILSDAEFETIIARRKLLENDLSFLNGRLLAIIFNLIGVIIAYLLIGSSFTNQSSILHFISYQVLWSFIGLLIFPKFSRAAIFSLDKKLKKESFDLYCSAIKKIDASYEDEFSRTEKLESVFHPLPSVARRIEKFNHNIENIDI